MVAASRGDEHAVKLGSDPVVLHAVDHGQAGDAAIVAKADAGRAGEQCAVSFVTGFCAAMASPERVVLLAGAAGSDGSASRCACCAASAGT